MADYERPNTIKYSPLDYDLPFSDYEAEFPETIFIRGVELRTVFLSRNGGLSSFNVEYPELNDFSDNTIVEVNRLIYDMIITNGSLNGSYYELYAFKDTWIDISISYRVTYAGDTLLSLHFFDYTRGGGLGARGYAEIQKAVTIDLDNGRVLSLGDIFTYEELHDIIENYFLSESNLINNAYAHYNMDEQAKSEFLHSMKTHFLEQLSSGELLNETRYFYITENGIGLIATNELFRDPFIVEVLFADL